MAVVGKLGKTGILQVHELDEKLPVLRKGLMQNYPLDGSLVHYVDCEQFPANTIQVLSYNSHSTTWRLKNELDSGNIINGAMTVNNGATSAQMAAADIVVCDWYVWGVSSGNMSSLKTAADNGAAVIATGNDTSTNVFVATVGTLGTENTYNGTFYDNAEVRAIMGDYAGTQIANTSTDPNYVIKTFNSLTTGRIVALYEHDYGTANIMGYMYIPHEGGGSLYFDEFGGNQNISANRPIYRHIINWMMGRKTHADYITQTGIQYNQIYRGTFIQKSFSNVVTNYDMITGWTTSYCTSIQYDDYPKPMGADPSGKVVSFIDANSDGSGYWFSYGNYAPQADNTRYEISMWIRTEPGGSNVAVRAYTADNAETDRVFTQIITVTANGDWQLIHFTTLLTDTGWDSDSLSFQFTTLPAGQRVWLYGPSMASGKWTTTPFHPGSLASHADLRLPLRLGTGNFTITGFITPQSEADGTYTSTAAQAALFGLKDLTSGDNVYYRYYVSGGSSYSYMDPDVSSTWNTTATSGHAHQGYDLDLYAHYMFIIERNSSTNITVRFRTHTGTLTGPHTMSYVSAAAVADQLKFGYGSTAMWESRISRVSIYNHSDFTDAELLREGDDYRLSLLLNKTGVLSTGGRNNVSEAEENLWPGATYGGSNSYAISSGTSTAVEGEYHQMVLSSYSGSRYKGWDIATANGATYAFSGEFWMSGTPLYTLACLRFEGEVSGSDSILWEQLEEEVWTPLTVYCVADTLVRFLTYPSSSSGPTTGTFRWRNMSVRRVYQNELLKLNNYDFVGLEIGELVENL